MGSSTTVDQDGYQFQLVILMVFFVLDTWMVAVPPVAFQWSDWAAFFIAGFICFERVACAFEKW